MPGLQHVKVMSAWHIFAGNIAAIPQGGVRACNQRTLEQHDDFTPEHIENGQPHLGIFSSAESVCFDFNII